MGENEEKSKRVHKQDRQIEELERNWKVASFFEVKNTNEYGKVLLSLGEEDHGI